MFRKALSLFLVLLSLYTIAFSEDNDLEITDILEYVPAESGPGLTLDSDGAVIMTVTCTGDLTIGGDNYHYKDIFTPELKAHDGNINFIFDNVRDILSADDLTIVNFEGTLTDTKYVPSSKKGNDFLFSISPSYVSVLTDNSVEAVSLENNHIMDHGEEG